MGRPLLFIPQGPLGCFRLQAVVNNTVLNVSAQVRQPAFNPFGCIPRSGIAGSWGDP